MDVVDCADGGVDGVCVVEGSGETEVGIVCARYEIFRLARRAADREISRPAGGARFSFVAELTSPFSA